MSDTTLDRLLAVLLAVAIGTGPMTWRAGSPSDTWLYTLHGAVSGILLVAVVVKLGRSLPRAIAAGRWRRLLVAVPLALLTLLSLGAGFAWVAGGRLVDLGPWTLLGWHGIFGLLIVAVVAVHLLPHRWRILRPRLGRRAAPVSVPDGRRGTFARRTVIGAGAMIAIGLAIWSTAGLLDLMGGRPRRFTGSRFLPAGSLPIPTTFLLDATPVLDPATWRLRVSGAVEEPVALSLDDLLGLGVGDLTAVLDCTGGWATVNRWQGIPMDVVLARVRPLATARSVEVRSATGWRSGFSLAEASTTLLATGVDGRTLPQANGAPCRLVAPHRRGLDWTKWVTEIVVS